MATKIQNQTPATPTDDQATIVEPTLVEQLDANGLDYLISEQKRIAEQIKAARAALPQQTPLDRVIAKQQATYEKFIPRGIAGRVRARIAAGQPREEALAAVLAFFVARANELLDTATDQTTE